MAVKINELKQKVLETRASLNALLDQQSTAKAKVAALLDQQIQAGTAGATEGRAAVAVLEAEAKSIDDKVSATRRLLQAREEELHAEEQRLEMETPSASAVSTHDNRQERPWANLGEMLQAVYEASRPGGRTDPRLFQAAASGANTAIPSEGGFLVQRDFSLAMMQRAVEASQLLPLCDSVPISENSDGLEAPYIDESSRATGSRWGGVQVFRRAEADTVTASKPKYGLFECRLEDLMGIAYATGRQLRDARATEAVITNAFGSEFAFAIDDEIVRGSGVGQILGILNAPCKVTQAKETGQAAATIVTKNLSKMWTRLPVRSKGRSIWVVNSETTPELDELTVPAGTGAVEPRIVRYGEDGVMRIKGRPVVEIEQAEALGTEGDILLVDMSEFVVITKGGLKTDTSIHVRFLYDEMTYRFMVAINGKPKWASALTPYKGTATKSPFVTLATRA